MKEIWEDKLTKMGVTIYKGELPKAIHGELHDPTKLREFIRETLATEKKALLERVEKLLWNWPEEEINLDKISEDKMEAYKLVQYNLIESIKRDLAKLKEIESNDKP